MSPKKPKTVPTRPREAGSPASLDRWQVAVQDMQRLIARLEDDHILLIATDSERLWATLKRRLGRLLASMQKAERR